MRIAQSLNSVFTPREAPRRSVRLQLTVLYASLFLVCGVALLAITYLLVRHATAGDANRAYVAVPAHGPAGVVPAHPSGSRNATQVAVGARYQNGVDLNQLLVQSGIALSVMTIASALLGWLVAGRVLAPLRTMTAATRRISEHSLHDRLALPGPRDELTELADTIDGLLARLETAFEAQRRFVANASHELRTPLATMRASLDVAMAKPEPPPAHILGLEQRLRNEFDHVERLLESFLVLARAEHAEITDATLVSLAEIAATAVENRAATRAKLELTIEQADDPDAWVHGSPTLLQRMVDNLIDNAVSHNQPGGWVRVATTKNGSLACIIVENGGQALDQCEVNRLAQPFTRLRADRTGSDSSTGLGLSIVQAIAHAHAGKLDLHARAQGGLCVTIELPLAATAPAGALT